MFWQKKKPEGIIHSVQERLDLEILRHLSPRKIPTLQQLRFAPKLLDATEKRKALAGIIVAVLALLFLILRLYWGATMLAPAVGGTYTEGLVGTSRFINPLLALGNEPDRDIASLVFSGLLKTDAQGNLVPDLASQYFISDDEKIYTFQLRDNVSWHDGEPLTVDDVVYTFTTAQDPTFKSPYRGVFANVQVRKIDRSTVSFILPTSQPSFLNSLTVGIIPEHIWSPIPAAQAQLAEANLKPIGSGPYHFTAFTRDSTGSLKNITLKRYANYYGAKPYIDELDFKFYPDNEAAIEALQNKNVDGLTFIPTEYTDRLEQIKMVQLKKIEEPQHVALFFNPEKNAILKDVQVRLALNQSIDRNRIVKDALQGYGTAISVPVFPGITIPTNEHIPDSTGAIATLDKAGWKIDEKTQLRTKDKNELRISITTSDQPEFQNAAALLKQNFTALGIPTDIVTVTRQKIRKDVIEPRNYQILLYGQLNTSIQDAYAFWHSSQTKYPGNNLSTITDKEVDAAVQEFKSAKDQAKQQEAYDKLAKELTDNALAIFLYTPTYIYPVSGSVKGLEGMQQVLLPSQRFTTINQWYLKTARRWK